MRYAADLADTPGGPPPPVDQWDPPDRGSIDIVIRADGVWLHEGAPIERARLVRLFASILRREGEAFYLVTPVEKRRIVVEDAPFLAVLMEKEGDRLVFVTNLNECVAAGAEHPITFRSHTANESDEESDRGAPAPYIKVRGGLEAKIARSVYYELAALGERDETKDAFGVWSDGTFFAFPEA